MRALPQREVSTPASAGDSVQSGPALPDVLCAAAVAPGYRSVRVLGRTESVTLSGAESWCSAPEVTPEQIAAAVGEFLQTRSAPGAPLP